ncbi:DUF4397 domain-containing protein [Mucilaginibacter sabulilitoris]|uniref:DUF4397 domain-containing protein n=1 Tax=Mucilaginibacter sabulilitoris TaxID=1173583 RepID=A0ABZ0TRF0_9SPHI|nr:DUF4397 domain-containing protein [Mucilaginibacter sabulilitoris]WPU95487.1 DUF4397 domain-containing protein [Mucilaginibacter sabulilitoris]
MDIRIKILFIVAVGLYLSSCKKNDDRPQARLTTNLNVVNVSNNTINFYQNGTRLNNTGSYIPGGTLGYIPVLAGTQNLQIKVAGNSDPLFSLPLALDTGKLYSLYIGPTAGDTFSTTDVFESPGPDSIMVRFVNASPDAGLLGVSFHSSDANSTVITPSEFKDVEYKKTTNFIATQSGELILNVYKSSAPADPKIDTLTFNSGGIYTIYSYGTLGSGGIANLNTRLVNNQ